MSFCKPLRIFKKIVMDKNLVDKHLLTLNHKIESYNNDEDKEHKYTRVYCCSTFQLG